MTPLLRALLDAANLDDKASLYALADAILDAEPDARLEFLRFVVTDTKILRDEVNRVRIDLDSRLGHNSRAQRFRCERRIPRLRERDEPSLRHEDLIWSDLNRRMFIDLSQRLLPGHWYAIRFDTSVRDDDYSFGPVSEMRAELTVSPLDGGDILTDELSLPPPSSPPPPPLPPYPPRTSAPAP